MVYLAELEGLGSGTEPFPCPPPPPHMQHLHIVPTLTLTPPLPVLLAVRFCQWRGDHIVKLLVPQGAIQSLQALVRRKPANPTRGNLICHSTYLPWRPGKEKYPILRHGCYVCLNKLTNSARTK